LRGWGGWWRCWMRGSMLWLRLRLRIDGVRWGCDG
jgi:hypothetical protein